MCLGLPYYYADGTPWVWPVRQLGMQPPSAHDVTAYSEDDEQLQTVSELEHCVNGRLASTAAAVLRVDAVFLL